MKTLITEIQAAVTTLPGWCTENKALNLASLVLALRPRLSVEIGIFGGRSFIPLALAHREIGHGNVIGIDPWEPMESVKGQTEQHVHWWQNHSLHRNAESMARKAVTDFAVKDFCVIQKITSDAFVPPDNIGILHVDGNHSEQAIRDVTRYAPKVSVGGFVVMDDLTWDNGGPSQAVSCLIKSGFRELYIVREDYKSAKDDYGVYQRVA